VKNVYEKAGMCYKCVVKQNYRISPKLNKNQILKACSTSPGTSFGKVIAKKIGATLDLATCGGNFNLIILRRGKHVYF
jgi:hypothetical protein